MIVMACKEPIHNHTSNSSSSEPAEIEKEFQQNKSRDVWQQPSQVLDKLGNIEGKTVADIGAGTGFFAFRLLLRNANVIAIDIDPKMLSIIESFRLNLSQEMQQHIETRLALPNNPMIKKDEADIILIINTIGYITDQVGYLKNIREKLPENGKLMIVDFKSKALPIEAPDQADRVPLYLLEKELREVGFSSIASDDSTLDYQYIVIADK